MKSTEFAEELLISLSNELESNSEHIKNEVYNILLKIPAGKVSTYGDIAKALGYPKAPAWWARSYMTIQILSLSLVIE